MLEIQKIKQLPTVANIENLSLDELGIVANREAQAGDEAFVRGLQHYKASGDYLIAAKAKGKADIGSSFRWSEWLKTNWKKSHTQAGKYMQLATDWEKISLRGEFSEDIGLNAALKLSTIEPETVEVEVLEKEVIKEVTVKEIVEVDKPGMVAKSKLDKVITENQQLKNQVAELTKSTNKSEISDLKLEIDKFKKQDIQNEQKLKKQASDYEQKIKKQIEAYEELLKPKEVLTDEQLREVEKLQHELNPEMSRRNFEQIMIYFIRNVSDRPDLYTEPETEYINEIIDFIKSFVVLPTKKYRD